MWILNKNKKNKEEQKDVDSDDSAYHAYLCGWYPVLSSGGGGGGGGIKNESKEELKTDFFGNPLRITDQLGNPYKPSQPLKQLTHLDL